MSFPSYPHYKDSGVSCLGRIPIHWDVVPAKYKIKTISGGQTTKNLVSNEQLDGLYPAFSASGQDIWTEEYEFDVNGVVLSAVGARCGKTFKANGKWSVVANTHCLFPKQDVDRDYIWYLTNQEDWWEKGGTAQPFVKVNDSLAKKIAIPSLDEQRKIAIFLDHEIKKIESLFTEQENLIQLLREKRQTIISHAVTKGLDPRVKMKSTGVKWLGEVPEHWEATKIKNIGNIRYGIGEPPIYRDEGTRLIRATNVHAGKIFPKGLVHVDANDIPAQRIVWLKKGDIIVVRSGAYTGDSAIISSEYENSIAGFDMVLRCVTANPGFIQYALLSNYLKNNQIDLEKSRAAQPHLNAEELGSCRVFLPPATEQNEIEEYLNKFCEVIDQLIDVSMSATNLLQERRSALISAAVTGQIDVRNYQSKEVG